MGQARSHLRVIVVKEVVKSGAVNSLQSWTIVIILLSRATLLQCRATIQKRPVNLCDTRTNESLCLLAGKTWFENEVFFELMPVRWL